MTTNLLLLLYAGSLAALVKGLQVASMTFWNLPWWLVHPQGWLIVIALGVCWFFFKQRPSNHAILFALAFPLGVLFVSFWASFATYEAVETVGTALDNWGREWEMDRTGNLSLMLMYVCLGLVLIFKPINQADIVGKGMFVLLAIGEAYMWLENWLCNIAFPTKGSDIIAAKIEGTDLIYACSRVDFEVLIWLPATLQIAAMVVMAWLLQQAKEREA